MASMNHTLPGQKDKVQISPFVGYEFRENPQLYNKDMAVITPKFDNPKYAYFIESMRKNTHCQKKPELFDDAHKGKFEMGKDNVKVFYKGKNHTIMENPKKIIDEDGQFKAGMDPELANAIGGLLSGDLLAGGVDCTGGSKTERILPTQGNYEIDYKPTLRQGRPAQEFDGVRSQTELSPSKIIEKKSGYQDNAEDSKKFWRAVTNRENLRQKKFVPRDLSMGKLLDDRAKLVNQSMRKQSSSVRNLRDHGVMKTEPNEQIYRSQSNPKARGKETYDGPTYYGFDQDGVEQSKTSRKIKYESLIENTTRNYDHHRSASNPKERRVKFEHTANDFANGKMPDRISEKKHFSKAIFKPQMEKAMRSMEQKQFDQMINSERPEYKRQMFNNPIKTSILDKFKKDKQEGTTYPNHKKMKQASTCNWSDFRNFNQRVNYDIHPHPKPDSRKWDVKKEDVINYLKDNKKDVYNNKELLSNVMKLKGVSNYNIRHPISTTHRAEPLKWMYHDYHTKAGAQGFTRNYENCGHPYYYV